MLEVEDQVMTVGGKSSARVIVIIRVVQTVSFDRLGPPLRSVVEFPDIDAHLLTVPADDGFVHRSVVYPISE
jgi:hypothetical protein